MVVVEDKSASIIPRVLVDASSSIHTVHILGAENENSVIPLKAKRCLFSWLTGNAYLALSPNLIDLPTH